ncbi:MAG: hypothetical protein WEB33_00920 [Bacteroidota bacterium]
MNHFRKIALVSFALSLPGVIGFLFFDHAATSVPIQIANIVFIVIGVVAFFIFLREPTVRGKMIFLNFAVFFLASLTGLLFPFIGKSFFSDNPFAGLYFDQYIMRGMVVFLLAFTVLYAVVDSVFSQFTILRKYIVTFIIVGGVFSYYYHPFFTDPRYLYKTPEIEDFRSVDRVVNDLKMEGNVNPTPSDIAERVTLNAWNANKPVGSLFREDNLARIAFILPYLNGNNYTMLLLKPLYKNVIFIDVLAIMFIIVFFGYQYKKDPPQGAYTEKILFLFLPLCSLDILHYLAYVSLQNYDVYFELYSIGQYLIIVNSLFLLIFFSLRLSFITSVKGEFYERELVLDSEHISRWRDGIDSLIVRHFLNPKTFHGRLFTPRESKPRA